jgi:DNA-binding GntR family transcriptional regulator
LVERVAETIRVQVISGILAPCQPLRQSALAHRLGVSPTPVREALRELQAEGYVKQHPYRGMVVTQPSVAEIEDLTEMRIALDTIAIRRAIPRLTAADLDDLARILDVREGEDDPARVAELLVDYFAVLFRPLRGSYLLDHIEMMVRRSALYSAMFNRIPPNRRPPTFLFREIIEACRHGDAVAAARLMDSGYRAFTAGFILHYGPLLGTVEVDVDEPPRVELAPSRNPREVSIAGH